MITEQAETIMVEMHERLIMKEKSPKLLALINYYWEVEAELIRLIKRLTLWYYSASY